MAANFTKWFPSGFRLINGLTLSNWFNTPQVSYEDLITAKAGGGQAGAYQLTARINRVSVAVNAGDSVKLPNASMAPGAEVWVINDGAQNIQVFSFSVATIDGIAGNIGVTVSAGRRSVFLGTKGNPNGAWESAGMAKST